MLMNKLETWAMNNPVRALVQRHVEARYLERMGGRIEGGTALELGCGRGEGISIILERFGAARVVGIDLDENQLARARARLAGRYAGRVELRLGDAEHLNFPDATFDAVFDFTILHHVPNWQGALREIRRVLKPSGRFYFEEVLRGLLETRAVKAAFQHPPEAHFSADAFMECCRAAGLLPIQPPKVLGSWFIGGVATP